MEAAPPPPQGDGGSCRAGTPRRDSGQSIRARNRKSDMGRAPCPPPRNRAQTPAGRDGNHAISGLRPKGDREELEDAKADAKKKLMSASRLRVVVGCPKKITHDKSE